MTGGALALVSDRKRNVPDHGPVVPAWSARARQKYRRFGCRSRFTSNEVRPLAPSATPLAEVKRPSAGPVSAASLSATWKSYVREPLPPVALLTVSDGRPAATASSWGAASVGADRLPLGEPGEFPQD